MNLHFLIVEDDPDVAEYIELALQEGEYRTKVAGTIQDAGNMLDSLQFDLILLDINLPGGSGLELIRHVRGHKNQIPIIIVSSESEVNSRIKALDLGADDYVVKPFSPLELLARIRALLRRRNDGNTLKLSIADLEVDLIGNNVTRAEKLIELTQQEFALLEYLLRFKGQIVTSSMLERDVWKVNRRATSLDNVIRVHISNLRNKIDHDADVKLIHTVWGKGYSIRATEPA